MTEKPCKHPHTRQWGWITEDQLLFDNDENLLLAGDAHFWVGTTIWLGCLDCGEIIMSRVMKKRKVRWPTEKPEKKKKAKGEVEIVV